jgi:hypothetical protein
MYATHLDHFGWRTTDLRQPTNRQGTTVSTVAQTQRNIATSQHSCQSPDRQQSLAINHGVRRRGHGIRARAAPWPSSSLYYYLHHSSSLAAVVVAAAV